MDPDTFTLLPLTMDASTKAITTTSTATPTLTSELILLNTLHRTLLTLDTPNQTPPPPVPVNPKRSAAIQKLRDSGNASFRKSAFADAVNLYSLAIRMAAERPAWEPAGLVREELAALYANRAQARMAMQAWPEGAVDAETSVEMKRVGNQKAWWRRGRCLLEMGRAGEAREWVERGLEVEGKDAELGALLKECVGKMEKGGL